MCHTFSLLSGPVFSGGAAERNKDGDHINAHSCPMASFTFVLSSTEVTLLQTYTLVLPPPSRSHPCSRPFAGVLEGAQGHQFALSRERRHGLCPACQLLSTSHADRVSEVWWRHDSEGDTGCLNPVALLTATLTSSPFTQAFFRPQRLRTDTRPSQDPLDHRVSTPLLGPSPPCSPLTNRIDPTSPSDHVLLMTR